MDVFMSLISQKFPRCVNVHWHFHVPSRENVTESSKWRRLKPVLRPLPYIWHSDIKFCTLVIAAWLVFHGHTIISSTFKSRHYAGFILGLTWPCPREQVPSAIFKSKLCTSYITLNYHKILHLYDHHDGQPSVHGNAAAKPKTSICPGRASWHETHAIIAHTDVLQMFFNR